MIVIAELIFGELELIVVVHHCIFLHRRLPQGRRHSLPRVISLHHAVRSIITAISVIPQRHRVIHAVVCRHVDRLGLAHERATLLPQLALVSLQQVDQILIEQVLRLEPAG